MAQLLDERVAAALKPGSRLADCEALIADVQAERERLKSVKLEADARRSDPTLPEAEAAEAHLVHEETILRAIRIERAEMALGEAIRVKKAQARDAIARKRYERVRHERDVLAGELTDKVAPMIDQIVDYLARLRESDIEIASANVSLPDDCEPLESAEVVARGKHARQYGARPLVDWQVPLFDTPGLAWPVPFGSDGKAEAKRREAAEQARKRHDADREASKSRFLISVGDSRKRVSFPSAVTVEGLSPVQSTIDAWCYPEQAAMNREKGLKLEPRTRERAAEIENSRRLLESAAL
jgi:hypothetical protein